MIWLWGLLGLFGLLAAVLVIRAAVFRPEAAPAVSQEAVDYDREGAVAALRQLVQCRTISHPDPQLEDEAEFQRLIDLIPRLYPTVFERCSFQQLPHRGVLMRWPGKHSDAPCVMMAHFDVVDVQQEQWDKPPFDGIIEDGVLWGRGTLDTKATFNGILWAAQTLMRQGFRPEQDLYFAFSGSEEINGDGAKEIVAQLRRSGVRPALVLDEGGAVVENVFPGVKSPCGLIGISEKGMMNVRFRVRSQGGHASAPGVRTPIDILSQGCLRLKQHPFPMRLCRPARELFDTLGRHSTFAYRLVFANLWLFRPALDLLCRKQGGEMNALVRTTTAFTQMEGSSGRNVLPPSAWMISNLRLVPGDTVEQTRRRLIRTVKDPAIEVEVLESFEPSPVSDSHCEAYDRVAAAVLATWPGCIVSPYLMVQCADARHYGELSDHVYRFCAMELTAEERKTIHGNNERIRLEAIGKTVEFYIRLMKQC